MSIVSNELKYTYFVYFLKNKSRFAPFAWLIRLAIKRPYNHVEVVAVPSLSYMPVRFYGAVYPKSRLTGVKHIKERYELVKLIQLEDFKGYSYRDNLRYLDSLCGRPYSQAQILLQALSAVSYFLKRSLSRTKLNYDHLLICTELAAMFMGERLGYTFTSTYDACEFEDLINAKGGTNVNTST